ncbi:hypothetical protein [Antribacter gilvus]|uniref:hypothetical protein n=1 Tax=Antribacter gilvus TaxID=2304675 RepID=UPI000F776427|nr:hypothetical protein [Antribacter gilvus]
MTRVLVLGAIVAVSGGALVGVTLALGPALLAVLAILLALGGATAVAFIVPEPTETAETVTLSGPLVREVAAKEPEPEAAPEPLRAPTSLPAPQAAVPSAA